MATLATRTRSSTGAGAIVILILVLAFGNQAFAEWADKHAQGNTTWQLFLRTLAWPRWSFTSGADTSRTVIAHDLRALLLVIFVAAILGMGSASVLGGFGGFVLGWFSVIFGAALAGLITAFIVANATGFSALTAALSAAGYGLVTGWIVGLAAASTRRVAVD